MLRNLAQPEGYRLTALDGEIGRCRDFLFDDHRWTVRYMVADTGGWLVGRKVLISPVFLLLPDWETGRFPIRMTRRQIEDSPSLDSDAPVSRRYERAYHEFLSSPYYWMGNGLWGNYPYPGMLAVPQQRGELPEAPDAEPDATHVRSAREVTGYSVMASDGGKVGTVEDFLVEDSNWVLRYLVVDRSWLPFSKKVLVGTDWIEDVDWADQRIRVGLDEDRIANAPEFDSNTPVDEARETILLDYYGRPHRPAQQR